MATASKTEKLLSELRDQFDIIQHTNDSDMDVSNYLAEISDLPNLGNIDVYDYNADQDAAMERGLEVMGTIAEMYISDFKELSNHPYIKNKIREDARTYGDMLLASKLTKKMFIDTLREIDAGDNSARKREIAVLTVKEIRENILFSLTHKSSLEKFYKTMRADFLEVSGSSTQSTSQSGNNSTVGNASLNDMLFNILKNKK